MEKGCKNHDNYRTYDYHRFSPQFLLPFSIDSADFPCRDPAISSPHSFYGQNISSVLHSLPFSEHNDCSECGQNFRGNHAKRDLANHMKTHQKVETFCHFCKKDYKTKKGLNKHKKMSCPEHLHT